MSESITEQSTADISVVDQLKVTVQTDNPMLDAALKFFALRDGITVEQFCAEAIRASLQAAEDSGNNTFQS